MGDADVIGSYGGHRYVEYREKDGPVTILDRFLSLDPVDVEGKNVVTFYKELGNIYKDAPLYFEVEFSPTYSDCEIMLMVRLIEGSLGDFPSTLLAKKTVLVDDNSVWSKVTSDYPGFKNKQDTVVSLVIDYIDKQKCGGPLQLDFIQVSDESGPLGGRGIRSKD